jgi:hypothetical protein
MVALLALGAPRQQIWVPVQSAAPLQFWATPPLQFASVVHATLVPPSAVVVAQQTSAGTSHVSAPQANVLPVYDPLPELVPVFELAVEPELLAVFV